MTENDKNLVKINPKVGLFSRIDYGSSGFRKALVNIAFEVFSKWEKTNFNVLVGGLVSHKSLSEKVKGFIKAGIRRDKISKKNYAKFERFKHLLPSERLAARKGELETLFLKRCAKELSILLPKISSPDLEDPTKTKDVDLFITTSPAFDGVLGETVAQYLAELRSDIRGWNAGGDRFLVKYADKLFWALAPEKAVWMRNDYYSTAVERVIKDKIKRTSQSSPDLFVVGCFGSSINKPKGELPYRYVSLPVCHRLEETRVAENQIGVSVVEFPLDGSSHLFRTYNLKDLVARELNFIIAPDEVSDLQKKMIEVIKSRGVATPGILKYLLSVSVEQIEKELGKLMKQKPFSRKGQNWPGIIKQEAGKKYYFNLDWIRRHLQYSLSDDSWNEDRIVSFGCLHAGSVETDYKFFVEEVTNKILELKATILVDAGDTKEGLKHNLDKKGEIIAGMNNTTQEKFAAHLIGSVILEVFKKRLDSHLASVNQDGLIPDRLHKIISDSLVKFIYILGNHDLWETEEGHEPLEVFHLTLKNFLHEQMDAYLVSKNISHLEVTNILNEKVLRQEFFILPSGLKISVQHPHMARAKTTSLRPQGMLDFGKRYGCQIVIGANFHVSENVEEWDMDLGQCVCQELGTIKHGSNFERRKSKMVDQGIGYLRILSKDGRIFMTESAFYGEPKPRPPINNIDIINAFIKNLGIVPIKDIN